MVSVRTKVPDTRLTARATAAAVRSSRLRWASRPFSTLHISRSPPVGVLAVRAAVREERAVHVRHWPDQAPRRFMWSMARLAVGWSISSTTRPSFRNTMRSDNRRRRRVVGDHDDGLAELVHRQAEEGEQVGAGLGVEVARGLVGEDDLGPGHEGPGRRHPLLLAARELGGPVVEAVTKADDVDDAVEPLLVRLLAGEGEGEGDVLGRGERGQQVEGLEDEADAVPTQAGQALVVERAELGVADVDPAEGEGVEAGQAVEKGGLPRARRSHDRRELAPPDLQVDPVEGSHRVAVASVDLGGVNHPGGAAAVQECPPGGRVGGCGR